MNGRLLSCPVAKCDRLFEQRESHESRNVDLVDHLIMDHEVDVISMCQMVDEAEKAV
jgi:hypothetical protein